MKNDEEKSGNKAPTAACAKLEIRMTIIQLELLRIEMSQRWMSMEKLNDVTKQQSQREH